MTLRSSTTGRSPSSPTADEPGCSEDHRPRFYSEAFMNAMTIVRHMGKPDYFITITVVFAGDWRQILPVVHHGSRAYIVDACLKKSYIWQHVRPLEMTTNVRAAKAGKSTQAFAQFLLRVGDGRLPINHDVGPMKVALTVHLLLKSNSLDDLCHFVFEQLETNYDTAILCPTNADVDEVNNLMIESFPGEATEYKSFDSVTDNEHQYPIEFFNSLTPSGLPPHRLLLKKHTSVMLLRNLDPYNGHVNGARYAIRALHRHVIVAVVATGTHAGKEIYLPRIPFVPIVSHYPFQMKRKQFPVCAAFGVTCNKRQGQTFHTVGIYLHRPLFSHGQLYVALSRVVAQDRLKVLFRKQTHDHGMHYTDNVVYPEIL